MLLVFAVSVVAVAVALILGASVVLAAKTIAEAVQAHGAALAGFWGTTSAETKYVPLDEVLADAQMADPTRYVTADLVLDSEL